MSTQQRQVGYRFRPKIDFLIKLLQYKAAGGGDITGCTQYPEDLYYLDLYGPEKEPWKVFSGKHQIWELHDINKSTTREKYVLTKLTKPRVKNVIRTAGAGSWDDQSVPRYVEVNGNNLGYWKTLTYEYWGGDGAEADKDYYYMNELHLTDEALEEVGAKSTNFVICRVLKNELKRCRIKQGKKRLIGKYDDCSVPKKKTKTTTKTTTKKKNKCVQFKEEEDCSTSGTKQMDDISQECCFNQGIDYNTANLRESMPDFYGILEQDEQDLQQGNFTSALMDDIYPQMQGNLDHQAQQFSSEPVYVVSDQCSDYKYVSDSVYQKYQQQQAYVPYLSGLEQYQQQQAYSPDLSELEQYQQQQAYVLDLSELEQYQQQQVTEYSGSSCVPDQCSGMEEYQQQEVAYLDDGDFSGAEEYQQQEAAYLDDGDFFGVDQNQQQEAYVGECSGMEENQEEGEFGMLQYLMEDSPVREVNFEELNNQWNFESLDNFFMGESCY